MKNLNSNKGGNKGKQQEDMIDVGVVKEKEEDVLLAANWCKPSTKDMNGF